MPPERRDGQTTLAPARGVGAGVDGDELEGGRHGRRRGEGNELVGRQDGGPCRVGRSPVKGGGWATAGGNAPREGRVGSGCRASLARGPVRPYRQPGPRRVREVGAI